MILFRCPAGHASARKYVIDQIAGLCEELDEKIRYCKRPAGSVLSQAQTGYDLSLFPASGTGMANMQCVLWDGASGGSAKATRAEPVGVVPVASGAWFTALPQEFDMASSVRPEPPSIICFALNGIAGEPQTRLTRIIELLSRTT
jgi:hypothetical protein